MTCQGLSNSQNGGDLALIIRAVNFQLAAAYRKRSTSDGTRVALLDFGGQTVCDSGEGPEV